MVIAHKFGEAEYAELLDEEENCGRTKYKHDLIEIEQETCVLILLAGPISELKYRRGKLEKVTIDDTKSNDYYRAKQVLGWNPLFDSDEQYSGKLKSYEEEANKEINRKWDAIVTVANKLLKNGKVVLEELENGA